MLCYHLLFFCEITSTTVSWDITFIYIHTKILIADTAHSKSDPKAHSERSARQPRRRNARDNNTWNAGLEALNTTDNSLWEAQRFLKNKRSQIPTLNCATGMAVTDPQKANLLANTIKNNFIENNRMQDNYDQDDEVVTSAVNTFLSSPPSTQIESVMLDEIINFIKNTSPKKAPDLFLSLQLLSKLTEYIILNRLKKFINDNSLINPNQYGFTNKLSTLHPLLRLTESISEGFQKKKSTGVVFLDIQKAFDRVWILGLTFKLITYDIPSPLIHLIHSYLTNRSFRIRVNESLSNSHSISAGCPQGSLLGPLLFNLYINDIPSYSLTNISLYADDTAINATYKNLKTFAINKHLKLLENYYDRWKISINVENLVQSSLPKTHHSSPSINVQ
ncbi:probable RNA-directed DNA polymerase from transposon X-element [Trichonephila clavipes]|nr:probable RNA-directed DNA polymerase from transposon X-element [Trichonephila clavipes]